MGSDNNDCNLKGDSLAEVSKEMGHSTQEITCRTYYMFSEGIQRKLAFHLSRSWPIGINFSQVTIYWHPQKVKPIGLTDLTASSALDILAHRSR